MSWRLPAEWEPQESLWLVWPRDEATWPGGRIRGARAAFAQAIGHVAPHQRVDLVVHPGLVADVRRAVGDVPGVVLHAVEYVDSWIRDYGPLYVLDGQGRRSAVKFRFDAWGGKYESLMADDAVVDRLEAAGAIPDPVESVDFVLEGGAVETDGQGTFLATESVAAARGQSRDEVESVLRSRLGARKVLWLRDGVAGDDTDGHIDTIARFVAPATVVASLPSAPSHPDHAALTENLERLHSMTDARGRRLHVLELPVPEPVCTDEGDPLPAGHANFLVSNGAVLVPAYGGPSDLEALRVLGTCFPGRDLVPLDHRDLIWGYGGIHCLSMQVPVRWGRRAPGAGG